jgi:hypothetical protein
MIKALFAGFSYFAVVFTAGFVLGALRMLVLAPALGASAAVVVEVPIMLLISWYVCRAIVDRMEVPASVSHRVAMGALAFALLMAAELALSMVLLGRSFSQHLAAYAAAGNMLGLGAQIAFGLFPTVQLVMTTSSRRSA